MVSVLMSIYNETLNEIHQSMDSVLSQSFSDFEVIVVLDRPDYEEALVLLQEYVQTDNRVRLLINEKNIGLAMSMNRAAEYALGDYLLRMDADDICLPGRFQLEYESISKGEYDLVCGNYEFIDVDGNLLPRKVTVYTDRQLERLLPLRNVIHHPTVIMTTETFRKVGGYRNYLCAQDYDLWLRMKCAGVRMHMLPEKMIQYRIRPDATTSQKRYKQYCTIEYIRSLYRQNEKMVGYSYSAYMDYLEQRGANNPKSNADFWEFFQRYTIAKQELKHGHWRHGLRLLYQVVRYSKHYRPHFMQSLRIEAILKFVK